MTVTDHSPRAGRASAVRQSNFELLRIVAALLIVAGHFGSHSGFEFAPGILSINKLWIEFFEIGGNISVDLFVLLSGYFRIHSDGPKTVQLIQLWIRLFFYSMVIYFIFVIAGKDPLAFGEIIRRALPVSFRQWWFASTFFMLTLFSPYLNRLLKSFSRKQYLGFLILTCFCWSIMPTITGQDFESNHLLWFVFLYSLAGYLRLYGIKTKLSAGKLIALSAVCALLTFLSVVLLDKLGASSPYIQEKRFYFYEIQRIPLLIISLLLFLGFSRLRVKPHRGINTLASAMFGVYLIHDHEYIRYFIWLDLFRNREHGEDPMLFLRFLGEIALVFSLCTLIELGRIYLLEKKYMPAVRRVAEYINKKTESLFCRNNHIQPPMDLGDS